MDSLLPLIKNPVNLKIKVKEFASQSPNLESSNSLSGTGSVDENLIATSATSSKSGEVTDSLSNLPSLSQVTTKAETSGAKEIKACFCCFWVFPQSFRGEEKNIHIDRCMEGLGEKDKRLWSRCQGDLKQYRHNFESEIYGSEQKIKNSRAKKPSSRVNKEIKEKDGAKKKKEKEEAIKDSKKNENKTLKRSKKVEEVEDNPDVIEIEVVKKCKLNSQKAKISPVEKEGKKIEGKGYTNIIYIPLANELIFNPSKEFEKFVKK